MNSNPVIRFDGKSLIVGALFASSFLTLLGADKSGTSKVDELEQRFLVLESKPVRDAANGYQSLLIKVCPFYGKIDQDSLQFRLASETQEINMIVVVSAGHEMARGDIIAFKSLDQLRLNPGSKVVRHLTSGDQELVP